MTADFELGRRRLRLALVAAALSACTDAHDPEVVEVQADDCVICHTPEFIAAADPPHVDVFPDECALCHSNTAWAPAIFEHAAVANRTCALCHLADYRATSAPVHEGMFPTTCIDCHGTRAWQPALEGAHPEASFPIADGPHDKIACTQCHDVDRGASAAGVNTDCIGCHTGEHNMNRVNEQHREVADYQYDPSMPNFCLLCHPNGRR